MQKKLKLPIYVCSFILLIYIISAISKSNSAEINYTYIQADSVGGNGGDISAMQKLNELVEENFLDRNYYEASSIDINGGIMCSANYNKKHGALFIGGSDG
jgi:hypothetical protein